MIEYIKRKNQRNISPHIKNGDLVQFADDTCIICSGRTHKEVSEMLCNDLCSLSSWIRNSHMEVNVKKSNVM